VVPRRWRWAPPPPSLRALAEFGFRDTFYVEWSGAELELVRVAAEGGRKKRGRTGGTGRVLVVVYHRAARVRFDTWLRLLCVVLPVYHPIAPFHAKSCAFLGLCLATFC
jgi:hypothetical protein